jgi:hypothetical protein
MVVPSPDANFPENLESGKNKRIFQINRGAKTTATIAIRGDEDTFGSLDGVVQ